MLPSRSSLHTEFPPPPAAPPHLQPCISKLLSWRALQAERRKALRTLQSTSHEVEWMYTGIREMELSWGGAVGPGRELQKFPGGQARLESNTMTYSRTIHL